MNDGREGFLLDGCGTEINPLKNRRVENVDAGIDAVADKLHWLLDEAIDKGWRVGGVDHNTIFRRLLHLCHYDGSLAAMRLVELGKLLERVFTNNI